MTDQDQRGGRRRRAASAATAALAVVGTVAVALGVASQESAPQPMASAPSPPSSSASAVPGRQSRPEQPNGLAGAEQALPAAQPTSITIPAIGVSSQLITVGRNPDGSMQVPQPGPNYDKAAWYEHSPTSGEIGPSVIVGHIDSAARGPSVFYRLGAMRPGQRVSVQRADGTVAVFTVDRVETYPKAEFPTLEVYGNTADPQLRLITCGGVFNDDTGNYRSNIVVYAHLTGTEPA